MAQTLGLEFTEEEMENPKLRKRIIGLVQAQSPQAIQEVVDKRVPPPAPIQPEPKEVIAERQTYLFSTTNKSTDG